MAKCLRRRSFAADALKLREGGKVIAQRGVVVAHARDALSASQLKKSFRRDPKRSGCGSPGHPFAPDGIEDQKQTGSLWRICIGDGGRDPDSQLHGVGLHESKASTRTCESPHAMVNAQARPKTKKAVPLDSTPGKA